MTALTVPGTARRGPVKPGSTLPAELVAADLEMHPATKLARWRFTKVAIVVGVTALPLLRPAGPGNTGLVDVALLGAMFAGALWASTRSHRLRVPYAMPVALIVVAGALAVLANGAGYAQPGHSLLALFQDGFVLGWAACVATMGADRALLDTFCKAWAYSASAWAAVLIGADIAGISAITGITANNGIRASFTLGDPNLAADYFLVSLFIIRAARRPRHNGARVLCCALTITAIILTLSNGGILALIVASALGGLFALARRRGTLVAVALGLLLALTGGAAVATIPIHEWITTVEASSPLVRDSLGREAESGGSRTTLLHEEIGLWMHGDNLLGVGPANTETTLRDRQAPYVKEAHDDYLAALVERGVLGGIALTLLIAAVAIRSRQITRPGAIPPEYRAIVPRPELLAAAAVAVGISAMFYEVLHFRHVWALLGLVAALDRSRRRSA